MPYADPAQRAAYHAKYYDANSEKLKAGAKAYREANLEKVKEQKKDHYTANREKMRAGAKAWREANPVKAMAWFKDNPEREKDRQKAYYKTNLEKVSARKKVANAKLRADIIARLGGCCARCSAVDNLEFDHVHDNGYEHRLEVLGRNDTTTATYRWMRDADLEEVQHGKYAIQLLCNECHRTKDTWATLPDLFFPSQQQAA